MTGRWWRVDGGVEQRWKRIRGKQTDGMKGKAAMMMMMMNKG